MIRLKPKKAAIRAIDEARKEDVRELTAADGTSAVDIPLLPTTGLADSPARRGFRGAGESEAMRTNRRRQRTGLRLFVVLAGLLAATAIGAGSAFAAECISAANDYAKQSGVLVQKQAAVKAARSAKAKAKANASLKQAVAAGNARKLSMEVACAALSGPQGAAGVQGAMGPAGAQGTQGDKGDTGDTGATGAKGDIGDTGAQGTQGDKGDTGDTGEKGDAGDTGAQGIQGVQGDMGPTGATGATGATGPAGANGTNGADGQDGADGEDGATGATGPSYSSSAKNAATVTMTSKGATPPTCVAGDAVIASLTVPVSPGGISGTYNLHLNAAATIVTTSGTRTGGIAVTVNGTIQGSRAYDTSTGSTNYASASTNLVVTDLSAASVNVINLIGCTSGNTTNVVANTGTLSVVATG